MNSENNYKALYEANLEETAEMVRQRNEQKRRADTFAETLRIIARRHDLLDPQREHVPEECPLCLAEGAVAPVHRLTSILLDKTVLVLTEALSDLRKSHFTCLRGKNLDCVFCDVVDLLSELRSLPPPAEPQPDAKDATIAELLVESLKWQVAEQKATAELEELKVEMDRKKVENLQVLRLENERSLRAFRDRLGTEMRQMARSMGVDLNPPFVDFQDD